MRFGGGCCGLYSTEQLRPLLRASSERAADTISKIDPDVLLLQELEDDEACQRLAEALKPAAYHVGICSAFKGPKQQVAILSKAPAWASWYELWHSVEGI